MSWPKFPGFTAFSLMCLVECVIDTPVSERRFVLLIDCRAAMNSEPTDRMFSRIDSGRSLPPHGRIIYVSSRAIYITAAISGVITVILVLAFVYVRRHREKWTIMSFAAAVLFGFATVAQVALAAAPAPAGSNGQGTPRPSSSSAGTAISSPTPVDLSYQLSASLGIPRTVNVKAQATGQPEPGLTYWFVLEVDYGKEYIEYYPRQKMSGGPTSFDVTIPPNAETKYVRTGRIYGLDSAQNAQAEVRLERQGASGKDDYFEKAIGKPVSNAVQLPF